jgi:hypothetical protein
MKSDSSAISKGMDARDAAKFGEWSVTGKIRGNHGANTAICEDGG